MTYSIYECSPKARAKIESEEDKYGVDSALNHYRSKYPLPLLRIGEAFAVPFTEGLEASVRNSAAIYGKKTGKKFTVISHKKAAVLEVARIA